MGKKKYRTLAFSLIANNLIKLKELSLDISKDKAIHQMLIDSEDSARITEEVKPIIINGKWATQLSKEQNGSN